MASLRVSYFLNYISSAILELFMGSSWVFLSFLGSSWVNKRIDAETVEIKIRIRTVVVLDITSTSKLIQRYKNISGTRLHEINMASLRVS
jgi:hypothetical protein